MSQVSSAQTLPLQGRFLGSLPGAASNDSETTKPADNRAALIMAWRAHPEVIVYCAPDNTPETWAAFRDDALGHQSLTWGVANQRRRYHKAAHYYGHGLTELAESDRAIIRAEHGDGIDIDPALARWVLMRDTAETCPVDLPPYYGDDDNPNATWPAAARAWAATYRAGLPEALRHFGMVVALTPGQSPIVGLWIGVEQSAATLRSWILRIGSGYENAEGSVIDDGRFEVVHDASGYEGLVAVEPRTVADVRSLAARPTNATTSGMLRTGIAELDSQLRLGGIPDGSLVIVQGGPKACKTTTELQLACAAREQGAEVVVIAGDESPAELHARLWQRQGLDPVQARERALRGEHADAGIYIVDPREHALQSILDAAAGDPAIRLIVVESVQTLAPAGQHEIDALLVRLRATGKTVIAASEVVTGARGRRAKGSTSIGYQASLTLDVVRKDAEVTITPVHSRLGSEEPIVLTLDADHQQLTGSAEPDAADAVVVEVVNALTDKDGPLSLRAVQVMARIDRRKADVLAALRRAVQLGKVTFSGGKHGKYTLRG